MSGQGRSQIMQGCTDIPNARLDISNSGVVGSIAIIMLRRFTRRSRICEHVGNLLSPQIEPVGRVF